MFITQSLRKAKGKLYARTMYHSVEGKQCYLDDTEGMWAWERKAFLPLFYKLVPGKSALFT